MANVETIQSENTDPNKGVDQSTVTESTIQTIQQPAPPPLAIKYAAQPTDQVAPVAPVYDNIDEFKTVQEVELPVELPKPKKAIDYVVRESDGNVKLSRGNRGNNGDTARKMTEEFEAEEAAQAEAALEPPERGIDFTKEKEQAEALKNEQLLQAEQEASIQARNIKNQFSHLASRNKDSGFVNSKNLAAFRDANNTLNDKRLNLNNQFSRDMISMGMEKARQDAEFNNENYQAWQNSNNDVINTFLDAGDFEAATDYALELSEVDDNPTWKKFKNPKYLDILKEGFDVEANNNFRTNVLTGINDTATRFSGSTGFQRKQAKDDILNLLDTQPISAEGYVDDFFEFLDPKEYSFFDISDADSKIIDRYKNGDIDFKDPTLRDIFAEAYMKDINRKFEDQKLEDSLSGVSDTVKNNSIGASIVRNLLSDSSGSSITFDPDSTITGSGITEFSMYNTAISADNIGGITNVPGLDIFFEDWNNEPFVDVGDGTTYTMEDARSEKVDVNGTEYTQGELTDMYLDYHKEKQREFSKITDPTQKSNFDVMNKEEFLREIGGIINNGVTDREGIEKAIRGQRTIDGVDVGANEVVIDGEPTHFEDLAFNPNEIADEDTRQTYIDILEGNTSINSLSDNALLDLLAAGTDREDYFEPKIMEELGIQSIDAPSSLQRGSKVQDKNHVFSSENLLDTLNSFDFENGSAEGVIVMDGVLYEVDAQAGRKHPSKDAKWEPAVEWNLTPVGGSDKITYHTWIPTLGGQTDKGRASELAEQWMLDPTRDPAKKSDDTLEDVERGLEIVTGIPSRDTAGKIIDIGKKIFW